MMRHSDIALRSIYLICPGTHLLYHFALLPALKPIIFSSPFDKVHPAGYKATQTGYHLACRILFSFGEAVYHGPLLLTAFFFAPISNGTIVMLCPWGLLHKFFMKFLLIEKFIRGRRIYPFETHK